MYINTTSRCWKRLLSSNSYRPHGSPRTCRSNGTREEEPCGRDECGIFRHREVVHIYTGLLVIDRTLFLPNRTFFYWPSMFGHICRTCSAIFAVLTALVNPHCPGLNIVPLYCCISLVEMPMYGRIFLHWPHCFSRYLDLPSRPSVYRIVIMWLKSYQ